MQYSDSTTKLQTVEIQRKRPQTAYVAHEIRLSIVTRLREHGDGIQRVAKQNGLTIRETVDVLEQTEMERRAAYNRRRGGGPVDGNVPDSASWAGKEGGVSDHGRRKAI